MNAFAQQTWYELLEVPTTASRAEILDAYARAMETYSPDSVAVYTLVEPEQIEALRQRLTQARDVLAEVEQRLAYDRQIGVKRTAEEQARLRAEALPPPVPPAPEVEKGVAEAPREAAPGEATATEPSEPEAPPATAPEDEVKAVAAEPAPAPDETRASEVPPVPVAAEPAPTPVETRTSEGSAAPVAAEPAPAPAPTAEVAPAPVTTPPAPLGASRPSVHARPSAPVARRGVGQPASPSRPGLRPLPTPGTRPALHPSAASAETPPRDSATEAPASTAATAPGSSAPSASATAVSASTAPASPAALARPSAPAPAAAPGGGSTESALAAQARGDARARPKIFFEIPPDAEFNGELLRRVRESRGLTLQTLAERTRISSKHMDNIEADRYEALPATVYLRGMLMSVARELGLDPLRVCRSYMGLVAANDKKRR